MEIATISSAYHFKPVSMYAFGRWFELEGGVTFRLSILPLRQISPEHLTLKDMVSAELGKGQEPQD